MKSPHIAKCVGFRIGEHICTFPNGKFYSIFLKRIAANVSLGYTLLKHQERERFSAELTLRAVIVVFYY